LVKSKNSKVPAKSELISDVGIFHQLAYNEIAYEGFHIENIPLNDVTFDKSHHSIYIFLRL
jgi:hypothetical protein